MKNLVLMFVAAMPLMQFAATWYVDGANGSDSNPGSLLLPKATIQASIDVAANDDTILVLPGTYAPIDASAKTVIIQSTGGAGVTTIDGNNEARCATLGSSGRNSTIIGFTLCGGRVSSGAGAAAYGFVKNCIMFKNKGESIVYACETRNCLAYGNTTVCSFLDIGYAVLMHGEAYNCTVIAQEGRRTALDNSCRNCILVGSVYLSSGQPECCHYCRTDMERGGTGNITADPQFRDAANGDYHLCKTSPCVDAGSNDYVSDAIDLDGNARIRNDRVDMGCYEYVVSTPVITPASGTIISTASMTVQMTCASTDAKIHYTTNGTTPTVESPVYSKFKVRGKTTVKAIAFYEEGTASDMAVAEYARGQCTNPTIVPADGTEFQHSGQTVLIENDNEEGTLRYTTDGSEPTSESAEYTGPFTIDETTTIKAKVFGDQYFDSAVVTATLTRVWLKVATPEISAQAQFTGSKQKVTIDCATDGALVRYTTNGADPNSHATKYKGPFYVTDTTTVKAYATKDDYTNSDIGTFVITKAWGIGDTMGKPDHAFATSGDAEFVRVADATATLGESMKSGEIDNEQQSVLSTKVMGSGTLTFRWKTSCEQDDEFEWDHAEFAVDGNVKTNLNGITDWVTVSQRIEGEGEHTVMWTYKKDDVEAQGEDCVWVADYAWASDYTATQTTDVPVPYTWLTAKWPDVVDEYESYESEAKKTAANPRFTVEQCYVAGLDPASATNEFMTSIEMIDGLPNITWNPDLETERTYKIWGSTNLVNGGDWEYPTNSLHRFFKVTVEMP